MADNKKANSVRNEARPTKRATTKTLIAGIDEAAKGHIADVNEKGDRIKESMSKGQRKY